MSRIDERMVMLECENENLQHKIAFLEQKLKELEENRSIPQKQSWIESPYKFIDGVQ